MLAPKPPRPVVLPTSIPRRRWGNRVTICIAAFSHQNRSLIAVSDQMLTIGCRTADDTALKQWWIHGQWCALYAGDAGIATTILQDARGQLKEGQPYKAREVGRVVGDAWARARIRLAEMKTLSAYGLTLPGFLARGAKQFQSSEYSRLCAAIEAINPDCDFLVCGFEEDDDGPYPHVLAVQDGIASDHDTMGYWAIGSGADLALGALAARRHNFRCDTATTLYNLLEARFAAEADPGVGRGGTFAMTWGVPHIPRRGILSQEVIQAIKYLWIQSRSEPPHGALEILNTVLAIQRGPDPGSEGRSDPLSPTPDPPSQPPSPE